MLDCALMDSPDGGEVAFVAASPTAPNHIAHIKFMKEISPTIQVQGFQGRRHAVRQR